ncbi:DUF397 domain-containing protein [Streptomyces uncialis]|uniref:DUF397 domain-containing protein n=1 Tax=Streptomyces uncialis TaxID=1048205 RepID=UPI00224EACF9|nr:DUF397 domain-containing protein [Streptomyces uncialis]MCX4663751.1 DUF397 domain-containing protein [Streptomyces uncialis]
MTAESPRWYKSSFSENGGACIEVATNLVATCATVPVRDSKQISGPVLTLTPRAFTGLVALARRADVS